MPVKNILFDVISFKLTEGLSEPFRLELMLSSFDPNISFSALMDQSVTFTFWQGEQPVRYLNGIVTSFRFGENRVCPYALSNGGGAGSRTSSISI